jgi:hypothetical protein
VNWDLLRKRREVPPTLIAGQHQGDDMESDKVVVLFIPVRKGMMAQMETFYGDVLRFTIADGEFS